LKSGAPPFAAFFCFLRRLLVISIKNSRVYSIPSGDTDSDITSYLGVSGVPGANARWVIKDEPDGGW
jgi:hypothetical protein